MPFQNRNTIMINNNKFLYIVFSSYLFSGITVSVSASVQSVDNCMPLFRRSGAPNILDEMILAIDNTRNFSSSGGLGLTNELPGLVHLRNFEHEENVVGFLNAAPDINESKAGILMGSCVRSEHNLPLRKVRNPIATQHVSHWHLPVF